MIKVNSYFFFFFLDLMITKVMIKAGMITKNANVINEALTAADDKIIAQSLIV